MAEFDVPDGFDLTSSLGEFEIPGECDFLNDILEAPPAPSPTARRGRPRKHSDLTPTSTVRAKKVYKPAIFPAPADRTSKDL